MKYIEIKVDSENNMKGSYHCWVAVETDDVPTEKKSRTRHVVRVTVGGPLRLKADCSIGTRDDAKIIS